MFFSAVMHFCPKHTFFCIRFRGVPKEAEEEQHERQPTILYGN